MAKDNWRESPYLTDTTVWYLPHVYLMKHMDCFVGEEEMFRGLGYERCDEFPEDQGMIVMHKPWKFPDD